MRPDNWGENGLFGPRGVFARTPLDALGMCPCPPAVSVPGGGVGMLRV